MIATIPLPEQDFAWEPKVVGALQDSYSVTFTFNMGKSVFQLLFPDPLAQLWWEASVLYRPFWWMHDET